MKDMMLNVLFYCSGFESSALKTEGQREFGDMVTDVFILSVLPKEVVYTFIGENKQCISRMCFGTRDG